MNLINCSVIQYNDDIHSTPQALFNSQGPSLLSY